MARRAGTRGALIPVYQFLLKWYTMFPWSHDPLQNKKIAFTQPLCNYCAVYAQV